MNFTIWFLKHLLEFISTKSLFTKTNLKSVLQVIMEKFLQVQFIYYVRMIITTWWNQETKTYTRASQNQSRKVSKFIFIIILCQDAMNFKSGIHIFRNDLCIAFEIFLMNFWNRHLNSNTWDVTSDSSVATRKV